MAQVSNHDLCLSFAIGTAFGPREMPVKLCRGAGLALDVLAARDCLHDRCDNGADGLRRIPVNRERFANKIIEHLSHTLKTSVHHGTIGQRWHRD